MIILLADWGCFKLYIMRSRDKMTLTDLLLLILILTIPPPPTPHPVDSDSHNDPPPPPPPPPPCMIILLADLGCFKLYIMSSRDKMTLTDLLLLIPILTIPSPPKLSSM